MGHTTHKAIVVTACGREEAEEIRKKAIGLGLDVSEIISTANSYESFFIPPHGWSWNPSEYEAQRDSFIEYLGSLSDGDQPEWVEVAFGMDCQGVAALRHSTIDSGRWTRPRSLSAGCGTSTRCGFGSRTATRSGRSAMRWRATSHSGDQP